MTLRPCPFCAAEPVHEVDLTVGETVMEMVSCTGCGAFLRTMVAHPRNVAAHWNMRATDDLLTELALVVKEAAKLFERAGIDVTHEQSLLAQVGEELGEEI